MTEPSHPLLLHQCECFLINVTGDPVSVAPRRSDVSREVIIYSLPALSTSANCENIVSLWFELWQIKALLFCKLSVSQSVGEAAIKPPCRQHHPGGVIVSCLLFSRVNLHCAALLSASVTSSSSSQHLHPAAPPPPPPPPSPQSPKQQTNYNR